MIALFHLNYWCETDEDKNKLRDIFKNNEVKYQEKLKEKYNTDNIFKKIEQKTTVIQDEQTINQTAMVEFKESIFNKIKNWFKKLFKLT